MRIVTVLVIGLISLPISAAFAAGTSSPPTHVEIAVPLSAAAARETFRIGVRAGSLKAVVELPLNFDPRRAYPVLLVCAPSGASAVASVPAYTNVARALGWIVTAVDGPKVAVEQDNNVFAWEMISSLLQTLRATWPHSKQWPFAIGGFSGGAKRAAMVAAEMAQRGDVIAGVFMGGCNEDRATLGYTISHPGSAFLNVPLFLSNGARDPIAGPAQAEQVKQSMMQTGFRRIRAEQYDGQHRLDTNQLRMALEWFKPKS